LAGTVRKALLSMQRLVCSRASTDNLDAAYEEMAADLAREAAALEWCEGLLPRC
jgi:hypothetical protein